MSEDLEEIEDGGILEPFHINQLVRELKRLRKMRGSGHIGVDNADGKSPPIIADYREDALLPAQVSSGIAGGTTGSPASAAGILLVPNAATVGFTATGGIPITIYNPYPTSLSGTVFVWVTFSNNQYYIVTAAC